jgi:hypothetical protein
LSFFQKIKQQFAPEVKVQKTEPLMPSVSNVVHEYRSFADSYRIGVLGYYTSYESQKPLKAYKELLEKNGYECETLMFVDNKLRDNNMFIPAFDWNDMDRNKIPFSPRTDRFILRRFDLLINLYFEKSEPLMYISAMSHAKCRVSAYLHHMEDITDVMVSLENNANIDDLVKQINSVLNLQPYVRKNF